MSRRRPAHDTAAVVLQASGPNALGIIRSLGREGVPVVACDHDPRALGTASRYARGAVTADPLREPERFVDDLLALGRRLRRPAVLFATHDEALAAIGPRQAEVDALFRRPWSDWESMRVTMDKGGQQAAARRIGFPMPATADPGPADDPLEAVRDAGLRFPVILKPRYAPEFRRRFRAQVLRADDPEALRRAWERAAEYGPQVQEVIPGGDEQLWTLGSHRAADGTPLASFTGRKLRQWPPAFGTARAAEARWDPDLAARCHALLDELGYHGISQVEVKRDPRDGRDHLIEVNPRSWLWISLATACGVNIPYACYLDALGTPRTWAPGHPGGRRWTLLGRHLPASAAEIRRGEWSARALAGSLRPPLVDGVLSARDPRPALVAYGRLARRAGGRR
jgi:predicted ATP-grasp superfamily ATP-dependent carboligase